MFVLKPTITRSSDMVLLVAIFVLVKLKKMSRVIN